jgi:hypothetical protein
MNSSEFTPRNIGEFANNRERCGPHQLRKRRGFPAMLSKKFTSFMRVLSQTSRQGIGRWQDLAQKFSLDAVENGS